MTNFQQRPPRFQATTQVDPGVRKLRATVTFHLGSLNTKINKDQIVGWDGYNLTMGSRQVEIQGIDGAIEKKWLVDLDDDYEYSPSPAKFSKQQNPIQFATEDNVEAEMKIEKNGSLTAKKLPNGMTMQPTQQRQIQKTANQRAAGLEVQQHQVPVMQISSDNKHSQPINVQPQKPITVQTGPKKAFRLGSVGIDD